MIQKTLLMTAALSTLLLTGCGKKQPEPNGLNNISDVAQIAGETVNINDDAYVKSSNGNHGNTGASTSGTFNSSADGFQSLYFGFGEYGISGNMEKNIATNVNIMKQTNAKIKIEGNCDEFGTDEYNYALGLKRAKAVKDSMVAQGIGADKMVMVSFGESNPVCSNPTDTCYARNRRVDLRLVK